MYRALAKTVANPGAGGTATLFDTTVWTQQSRAVGGFDVWLYLIGTACTFTYDVKAHDGTWRTVNNAGAGHVVADGDSAHWFLAVEGQEQRGRIALVGAATTWEVTWQAVYDQLIASVGP